MPNLVLVSHTLCPYVMRSAIVLVEKGVAFERVDIDLKAKPDWFLAISPFGRVPLLRVDDAVLFESSAICEYVDETTSPRLHPEDPLARAGHRAWMEHASALLTDTYVFVTTKDEIEFGKKRDAIVDKFGRVESALDPEGPYFDGKTFRVVDAVFAAVFSQLEAVRKFVDTDALTPTPRVGRWRKAVMDRASVRQEAGPRYVAAFEAYVERSDGHLRHLVGPRRGV
ncbi:MAG: glutathione S-transferase family protein [Polyangiaceae bacterium]